VTITHPHHPLFGQQVTVVRIIRGPDPDLIVRLRDGYHAAIAMSWTDYAGRGEAIPPAAVPGLLDLEGLRQVVRLVADLRRGAAQPNNAEGML
jgi:hypothetical protein